MEKQIFDIWYPKLEEKFDHYYGLVKREENIKIMDKLREKWLAPGFKERNRALYPKLDEKNTVISHCDA